MPDFKTEQLLEIVAFFLVEKVTDCDHRTLIVANVAFLEKLRFLLKLSKDTDRNKSPNRDTKLKLPLRKFVASTFEIKNEY